MAGYIQIKRRKLLDEEELETADLNRSQTLTWTSQEETLTPTQVMTPMFCQEAESPTSQITVSTLDPSLMTPPLSVSTETPLSLQSTTLNQQSRQASSGATTTANFRLSSLNLSLTFPQCPVEKGSALQQMKAKLPHLEAAMVVIEDHEDGSKHLHLYLRLSKRCNIRNPTFLDLQDSTGTVYHGNYQATRNIRDWIVYLSKEDKEPLLFNFCPEDVIAKKGGKMQILAEKIVAGATPQSIMEEDPGSYLAHAQKIKSFYADWKQLEYSRRPTPAGLIFKTELEEYEGLRNWLQHNILQQPRRRKCPQLYLYSAGPNTGKTTLIDKLREMVRVYEISPAEFDCNYYDDHFDVAVFEDWEGQRGFSYWKTFAEGVRTPLRKKGQPDYIKEVNIPVIITSNKLPRDIYKNMSVDAIMTWEERFTFVSCSTFIDITIEASNEAQEKGEEPQRVPFPSDYMI